YEHFVNALAKRAQSIRMGGPFDPQTNMGPLISKQQQRKVLDYIEAGRSEGALAVCGGEAGRDIGFYVQPTVFAEVSNDMRIAREEIFGPVAAVIPFESEEDGIRIANDTPFTL